MKVLCIGHAAYDITLPVDSYPIENKKIRIGNNKVECGGGPAATSAYLLAKWGIDASFAGVIGTDYYGSKIKEEFKHVGVNMDYLEERDDRGTTSSYIIANKGNGTRTIITNRSEDLEFRDIKTIEQSFDYILVDGDDFSVAMDTLIKNEGKAIRMIDAGKANDETIELSKYVDYLVCSNDFARDYTNMHLDYDNLDTIKAIYDKLEEDFHNTIIITLEKLGSFTKINGEYKLIPSIKVKAIDSTGAGDIFHGSLLYFLANHYSIEKAMRLANITSAISVTRIGGRYSIPHLEEVLAYDI